MNGAYYVGATGLQAQQRGLDVIANNIANINTTAFKRSEVRFSELVMQTAVREDAEQQVAIALPESLTGVQSRPSQRILEQGKLRQTGKPFDLAISGDGFIEVTGPSGQTWLWRGGTFRVNAEGLLETDSGLALKALIEVPVDAQEVVIDQDGRVRTVVAGASAPVELGLINIVMPEAASAVEATGDGYFRVAESDQLRTFTPGEDGKGVFVQGALETSNVDLNTEMVTLLVMQRAYAANAQVVQAADQLMAIANGLRR
jgi:flagellar basal-body rod protein FlgG